MKRFPRAAAWLAALFLPAACASLADDRAGPDKPLPGRVFVNGLFGFVDERGRAISEPRYAASGDWSEGRLWVRLKSADEREGRFLGESGRPIAKESFRDLADVMPESPLPRFERGIAVVGLAGGGYGYLDRRGRLLGRTTAGGVIQQQSDELLLSADGDKVGFIDRRGAPRIPARYAAATPFRGGRAAARAGERWGLIDLRGGWVAQPIHEELLWFADEPRYWMFRRGERWGLIDRDGRQLAEARYDDFGVWQGDTVAVRVGEQWGLLSADGELRVPPSYRALAPCDENAALWAALAGNARWGLIDDRGKVVAACRFDAVRKTDHDLWLAQQDGLWGILNRTNDTWLLAARYQRILPLENPFEGLALVEEGARWGVVETVAGKQRLAPRFARLRPWHRWLAAQEGRRVHLLEAVTGASVRSWEGEIDGLPEPEIMREGIGVVRTAAGVNLIDENGVLQWKEFFEEAGAWSEGLLPVRRDGIWGFVDRQGSWAVAPRFAAAGSFAEGMAPVCEADNWGICDRRGNYLVKPAFEALGRPWRGLVPARRGGRWGLIDRRGRVVLPLVYDSIEWGGGPVIGDQ